MCSSGVEGVREVYADMDRYLTCGAWRIARSKYDGALLSQGVIL